MKHSYLHFFGFALICALFITSPACADREGGISKWLNNDYSFDDFARPVFKDAENPHMHQWSDGDWVPEDWIIAEGSIEAVIDNLYAKRIVRDQTSEDDVPVLEVGNIFMTLSDDDRYKVVRFFDYAYNITGDNELGMIHIEHEGTNDHIGLYTKHGLQMQ